MSEENVVAFPGDITFTRFAELHQKLLDTILDADISVVAAVGILEIVKHDVLHPDDA